MLDQIVTLVGVFTTEVAAYLYGIREVFKVPDPLLRSKSCWEEGPIEPMTAWP